MLCGEALRSTGYDCAPASNTSLQRAPTASGIRSVGLDSEPQTRVSRATGTQSENSAGEDGSQERSVTTYLTSTSSASVFLPDAETFPSSSSSGSSDRPSMSASYSCIDFFSRSAGLGADTLTGAPNPPPPRAGAFLAPAFFFFLAAAAATSQLRRGACVTTE